MRRPIGNAIHTSAVPAVATWALALEAAPGSSISVWSQVRRWRQSVPAREQPGRTYWRRSNSQHLQPSLPPSKLGGRLHNVQSLAVKKESVIPNNSFSRGNAGWLSGMASASNWLRVRSICAEVNFIARSIGGSRRTPRAARLHKVGNAIVRLELHGVS